MHPPPFERAVYQTDTAIRPADLDSKVFESAEHITALGFVLGLTVDGDGGAWLYIEPADAACSVVRVALNRCRRANSLEGAEAGRLRARTIDAMKDRFCAERKATANPTT